MASSLGSIALGFIFLYLITGSLPLDFWSSIGHKGTGKLNEFLFITAIFLSMLAVPLRMMKTR